MVDLGARHGDRREPHRPTRCCSARSSPWSRWSSRPVAAMRRGAAGSGAIVIVALVVIAVRVVFRMVLDGQYGEHVLFRLPEIPLPDAAQGIRHRRPGVARRLARGVLRRPAARDVAHLLRRGERARQPEAPAEVDAERAARGRCVDHGRVDRRPAARRERAARASRSTTPQRRRLGDSTSLRQVVDPGDDRRARPLAPPRRGDGRTRARPHRARPTPRMRADQRRARARSACAASASASTALLDAHDAGGARRTDARPSASSAAMLGFALAGRRVHTTRYRPDPWRAAEWRRRGVRHRRRHGTLRRRATSTRPTSTRRCNRCSGRPRRCCRCSAILARRAPRVDRAAAATRRRSATRAARRDRSRSTASRAAHAHRGGGVIRIEHVAVHARRTRPRPVLRDVDLDDRRGRALPRRRPRPASGKSTLLGLINGLVPHFTGGHLAGRGRRRRSRHPRAQAPRPRRRRRLRRPGPRSPASSPTPSRRSSPTRWSSSACRPT